jgi:hypothetical protein
MIWPLSEFQNLGDAPGNEAAVSARGRYVAANAEHAFELSEWAGSVLALGGGCIAIE